MVSSTSYILQSTVGSIFVFEENHCTSQYILFIEYTANQQHQAGLELLEYVVRMYGTILHNIHPLRLQSEHTLALAYIDNRQREKALVLLRRIVEVQKIMCESTNSLREQSEKLLAELGGEAHSEVYRRELWLMLASVADLGKIKHV
jgi:hypothetical protein